MAIGTGSTSTVGTHAVLHYGTVVRQAVQPVAEAPVWSMSTEEHKQALVEVGAEEAPSSTRAWLAKATKQVVSAAHADVRFAKALDRDFDATGRALTQARVNLAQAG